MNPLGGFCWECPRVIRLSESGEPAQARGVGHYGEVTLNETGVAGSGSSSGIYSSSEQVAVQKNTVRTLLASQAMGGVGLVATYIVTALLAKDITGSNALATIAAASLSIGAAVVSFPLSRIMRSRGRRVGLRMAYLVGSIGGVVALLGAIMESYPLLVVGVFGAGAGSAANLATRYAASDLAPENRRARTISIIVWATTIGSTTGAIISGLASSVGEWLGLPDKAGSYLLASVMFLVAAVIVETFLRPDPLEVAGGMGRKDGPKEDHQSARESIGLIMASPGARLAVGAMVVSQITMVGVMALTPLHMDDGGQSQAAIGWMMAFHIWGMYAFSPFVGILTDRVGQYPMLYVSGALNMAGALSAAVTPSTGAFGVFIGNFLIGLGWCFGVIAGSSLMVQEFPIEKRVGVQGVGDMAMIAAGGVAGVSSGMLYAVFGYGGVNFGNAVFGLMLIIGTALTWIMARQRSVSQSTI